MASKAMMLPVVGELRRKYVMAKEIATLSYTLVDNLFSSGSPVNDPDKLLTRVLELQEAEINARLELLEAAEAEAGYTPGVDGKMLFDQLAIGGVVHWVREEPEEAAENSEEA